MKAIPVVVSSSTGKTMVNICKSIEGSQFYDIETRRSKDGVENFERTLRSARL